MNFCVREALDNGHCWIEYEDLVDQANLLLVMDALDSRVRIESALDALIEEQELACDSHGGRFVVALPELVRMERSWPRCSARPKHPTCISSPSRNSMP